MTHPLSLTVHRCSSVRQNIRSERAEHLGENHVGAGISTPLHREAEEIEIQG